MMDSDEPRDPAESHTNPANTRTNQEEPRTDLRALVKGLADEFPYLAEMKDQLIRAVVDPYRKGHINEREARTRWRTVVDSSMAPEQGNAPSPAESPAPANSPSAPVDATADAAAEGPKTVGPSADTQTGVPPTTPQASDAQPWEDSLRDVPAATDRREPGPDAPISDTPPPDAPGRDAPGTDVESIDGPQTPPTEPAVPPTVPMHGDPPPDPTRQTPTADSAATADATTSTDATAQEESDRAADPATAAAGKSHQAKSVITIDPGTGDRSSATVQEPVAKPPVRTAQWKVLEPEDRTDPVDHEVCAAAERNDQWSILAASVRGKLHAHKALWRDDSYAYDWVDDWTMIVVSDGAGSAKLSRIGSRIICDESVSELKKLLQGWMPSLDQQGQTSEAELLRLRSFLVMAARKALDGVRREAQARACDLRTMHATLLLMVHAPLGENDLVAAIQIGDGAVGIYSDDGNCTLLGVADHGEFSSETRFLTTPHIEREFEQRVLFSIKKGVRCLAAMSDGVSDDFFPEDKRLIELFVGDPIAGIRSKGADPVQGVMHELVHNPQDGRPLCDWLRYERKGSSDDRTLVLMYRSADRD